MRILILEADMQLPEGHSFIYWVEKMKNEGHQIRFIFNAYHNEEKIIKAINWPDIIAFATTFVYIHPIFHLTQAIAKYRKKPLEIIIEADDVREQIGRMIKMYAEVMKKDENGEYWEIDKEKAEEFAYSIRNFTIKKFSYSKYIAEKEDFLEVIDILQPYIDSRNKKIEEDRSYLESRKLPEARTGRFVKIKTFGYLPGPDWKIFKKGMVVPEIDMSLASDRIEKLSNRG